MITYTTTGQQYNDTLACIKPATNKGSDIDGLKPTG